MPWRATVESDGSGCERYETTCLVEICPLWLGKGWPLYSRPPSRPSHKQAKWKICSRHISSACRKEGTTSWNVRKFSTLLFGGGGMGALPPSAFPAPESPRYPRSSRWSASLPKACPPAAARCRAHGPNRSRAVHWVGKIQVKGVSRRPARLFNVRGVHAVSARRSPTCTNLREYYWEAKSHGPLLLCLPSAVSIFTSDELAGPGFLCGGGDSVIGADEVERGPSKRQGPAVDPTPAPRWAVVHQGSAGFRKVSPVALSELPRK